nr:POU domain, class 4, transcription factor 1-like [Procambarus clarkii]
MKLLFLLVATGVLAHPAPQHKLSGKAYVGLSQALGGRIPVGIYSAKRIFHGYENHDNDVVYLNLPGLSSAVGGGFAGDAGALGGGGLKGGALGGGALGGGALGGGALGGAVGKKGEALGSLVGGGLSHAAGAIGAAVGSGAVAGGDALGAPIGKGLAHGANGLGGGAFDAGDALGAAVGSGVSHGVGALAASFGGSEWGMRHLKRRHPALMSATNLHEIRESGRRVRPHRLISRRFFHEAGALAEQLGEGAGAALGSLSQTLFRSKRQDSEQSNANQISFALSGLGTLFGGNLGRWLDSTFDANVKFINGMENVGTIVLDQVDDILVRVGDRNRTKADGISLF